jgi:hypothetical protein
MSAYKKHFDRAIRRNFPEAAGAMIDALQRNHLEIAPDTAFAATSKNPIDRRLDFCGYFLALIRTLHDRGQTFNDVRRVCLEVVTDLVTPKNKMHALIKRIPPIFIGTWLGRLITQRLARKVDHNSNSQGFVANIITDKAQTFGLGFGVDIIECGICKLFAKHNFAKYASILCEVDELTSSMAGLTLIRSGTIANGAPICDFRYKKK